MLKLKDIITTKEIMDKAEQSLCALLGFPVTLTIDFSQNNELTVERVIEAVTAVTGVPAYEMVSRTRVTPILFARYYGIRLCHEFLKMSPAAIGHSFNRNRSSVLWSLKTFENLYSTSKKFKEDYAACERAFIERIMP